MKVLFAVDDSKFSDLAIETVGSRPWPVDTEFRILSVLELSRSEFDGSDTAVIGKLKADVESKAKVLETLHPSAKIEVKVLQGRAKDAILSHAEEWGSDLIVVGSHGRRGLQKFLLGSVAESILVQSPCAVEIVRIKGA
ncbi:universal stress protein [Candidatus Obscuribacterales bacterium]|jgi:nucleotide-binding universal stress UspA family protein|nr:universal stress protein [Candidatus Obscuribacterales bacterium]